MNCKECGTDQHVRNTKQFGPLCYFCFDKITDKMCLFQEDWLHKDIFPLLKEEVKNGIMESEDFRILDYIRDSEFAEIEVAEAIEEMLEENALPEKVRKFLADYQNLFLPNYDDDEAEEDWDDLE